MPPIAEPDEGLNAAVAAELRGERAAKGMTTKQLSERAGVPYASLRRYLAAERHIDVATMAELCRALDLDPGELVSRAAARSQRDDRAGRLLTMDERRRSRTYPTLDDEAARDSTGNPDA